MFFWNSFLYIFVTKFSLTFSFFKNLFFIFSKTFIFLMADSKVFFLIFFFSRLFSILFFYFCLYTPPLISQYLAAKMKVRGWECFAIFESSSFLAIDSLSLSFLKFLGVDVLVICFF